MVVKSPTSSTETVPLTVLATYTHGLFDSVATERGSSPVRTSVNLASVPSSSTAKNDTVPVSMLAAITVLPSSVTAIGPDFLLLVWAHRQAALQASPTKQPVALPSQSSPPPVSTMASPHSDVAALNGTVVPPAFRLPVTVEQLFPMSAVSRTLPLTPLHPRKTTLTAVPFFLRASVA